MCVCVLTPKASPQWWAPLALSAYCKHRRSWSLPVCTQEHTHTLHMRAHTHTTHHTTHPLHIHIHANMSSHIQIRSCVAPLNPDTYLQTKKFSKHFLLNYDSPNISYSYQQNKSLQRKILHDRQRLLPVRIYGTTNELHLPHTFLFIPRVFFKRNPKRRAMYACPFVLL